MLVGIVCAEQEITRVELHEYAAKGPDVRRRAPAQPQDHLRCAVLSRVDDGALFLVVIRRASEIDEADIRGWGHQDGFLDPGSCHLARVSEGGSAHEQDILRFQVRVHEPHFMKKCHCLKQLVGEHLHAVERQRAVLVFLEVVVKRGAESVEYQADVSSVRKALVETYR